MQIQLYRNFRTESGIYSNLILKLLNKIFQIIKLFYKKYKQCFIKVLILQILWMIIIFTTIRCAKVNCLQGCQPKSQFEKWSSHYCRKPAENMIKINFFRNFSEIIFKNQNVNNIKQMIAQLFHIHDFCRKCFLVKISCN